MINQQGNNSHSAYRDVLDALLLTDTSTTPAEIQRMLSMDVTLSSVLGAARQHLPRQVATGNPLNSSPLLPPCMQTLGGLSTPIQERLGASYGEMKLDRWAQHPECPLCGLELRQLAQGVEQSVQAERLRDQRFLESLLEKERLMHQQALQSAQSGGQTEIAELRHSLQTLERIVAEQVKPYLIATVSGMIEAVAQGKLDHASQNTRTKEMSQLQEALLQKTHSVEQYIVNEAVDKDKVRVLEAKLENCEQRLQLQLMQISNAAGQLAAEKQSLVVEKQSGSQIKKQTQDLGSAIASLQADHAMQLKQVQESKDHQLQQMQETKDLKLKLLEETKEQQLKLLQDHKNAEIEMLRQTNAAHVIQQQQVGAGQLTEANKQLTNEIAAKITLEQEKNAEIEALKQTNEGYLKQQQQTGAEQLTEANKQLAHEIAAKITLEQEKKQLEQTHGAEIEALQTTKDAEIETLRQAKDAEIETLRQTNESHVKQQEQIGADQLIEANKQLADEIAAKVVLEQEMKVLLTRETDKLLIESNEKLEAAMTQIKDQANKHKGDLVLMMESHDAEMKKLKKKKKKELEAKETEHASALSQAEKENMGKLVVFQDELDQEQAKVKELEDRLKT